MRRRLAELPHSVYWVCQNTLYRWIYLYLIHLPFNSDRGLRRTRERERDSMNEKK